MSVFGTLVLADRQIWAVSAALLAFLLACGVAMRLKCSAQKLRYAHLRSAAEQERQS